MSCFTSTWYIKVFSLSIILSDEGLDKILLTISFNKCVLFLLRPTFESRCVSLLRVVFTISLPIFWFSDFLTKLEKFSIEWQISVLVLSGNTPKTLSYTLIVVFLVSPVLVDTGARSMDVRHTPPIYDCSTPNWHCSISTGTTLGCR